MRQSGTTRTGSGRVAAILSAGAFLLAGCGDSTAPAGTGHLQFVLVGSGGAGALMASVAASEGAAAPATLDDVVSIDVVVVEVEALRVGGQGFPWVSLAVDDGGEIDLLDLGSAGIELASGEVPAGDYRNVRLHLEGATITFNRDVLVGQHEYEAFTPHPLTIPSAEQTGIKTLDVSFVVPESGSETVLLEFDAGATVQNLAATGAGTIIMNPVLKQGGG